MSRNLTVQTSKVWRFQIKALFMAHEIDDVVDGTRTLPEERSMAIAKTWIRDNAKAMFLISTALEPAQLEPLLVCESAKDMWDSLCRIHEQKLASNKLLLLQKFHEYRMGPNDSIEDVGEHVSELTVIAKIFGSLSVKYSTLQTAWDSVDPARQTFEHLEERLIREEARVGASEDGASAFAAAKNEKKSRGKKKSKGKKVNKNVECYRCNEMGHYAHECPSKKGGKSGDSVSGEPSGRQLRQFLAVRQGETWLTDSGVSRHMTYRREWLTDYRPIPNDGTFLTVSD
ncbi:uncharacterized protein [Temnothorax nylanderi]|uniref:uncharacterized protein n=1 Tax=Temnothorax nylanderi TaxID=102681 RepID=UPI003A87B7C4